MTYLTDKEKKLTVREICLQLAIGIALSCKTYGQVTDLVQEAYDLGFERGKEAKK
jgi:hypothetical protein